MQIDYTCCWFTVSNDFSNVLPSLPSYSLPDYNRFTLLSTVERLKGLQRDLAHTEYISLWVAKQYLAGGGGVRIFTVSGRAWGSQQGAISFCKVAVFNWAAGDIWCQDYRKAFPRQMEAGARFVTRRRREKSRDRDYAYVLQNVCRPRWEILC